MREKFLLVSCNGILLEQWISTGGYHDGIDYEMAFGALAQQGGDGGDDVPGIQHAGFQRGDGKGLEEELQLIRDHVGICGLDTSNNARRFRDDAGNHAEAIALVRGESLAVGLQARAA